MKWFAVSKFADCGLADQYNFWCSGRFLRKLQNLTSVGSVTLGICIGFTDNQPTNVKTTKNQHLDEVPISVTLSTPPLLAQVMDQVSEDQTPGQISALRGKNNTMTTL